MRSHVVRPGRAATPLLLAMLLYIGGMVLDPVVHAFANGSATAAASDSDAQDGEELPPQDHDCGFCNLPRSFAAAGAASAAAWAPGLVAVAAPTRDAEVRGPLFVSTLCSRAPPLA